MLSFPNMNPSQAKDPRQESFGYMLYTNFCPYLSLLSFTVLGSGLLTAMFVLQLGLDGLTPGKARHFLQIDDDGMMTGHLVSQYTALKSRPYSPYSPSSPDPTNLQPTTSGGDR